MQRLSMRAFRDLIGKALACMVRGHLQELTLTCTIGPKAILDAVATRLTAGTLRGHHPSSMFRHDLQADLSDF